MARNPADRGGPTDPDEDDIKRILESMWEIKSRDDGRSVIPDDGQIRGDSVDFYDIEPLSADGFEGVAPDTGVFDVEPASASSERLADRLKGVGADLNSLDASSWSAESADANGVDPNNHSETSGAGGAPDAHQLLSSLSCKEGGQSSAVNDMGTQTPQGDDHNGHVNGHGLNGSSIVIEHSADKVSLDQGGVQSPEAIAMSQSPVDGKSDHQQAAAHDVSEAHVEDPIVKREMASFFDSRMKGMAAMGGGGGGSPAPRPNAASVAPAPQAAPRAPAPVAAAAPVAPAPVAPVAPQTAAPQTAAPQQAAVAPSHHGNDSAAELMRPVLRQWLGENMPKIVESALQIEAAESAGHDDSGKPDK